MTATAFENSNGWSPIQPGTELPSGNTHGLAANASAGMGQTVYFDVNGDTVLNDGTVANQLAAGVVYPTRLAGPNTIARATALMVHKGLGSGIPASTITDDGFSLADQAVVAYDAGNGVPGKLSVYGGYKRSIMGLVFGTDDKATPILWVSPVASLLARLSLQLTTSRLASTEIADAAASTAIAEKTIDHAQLGGLVTGIVFNGAAIAADNTDYITVTISKRDGAGGAAVVLGTLDSRAANNGAVTAFVDKAFTLSVVAGALNLLSTDIVTITTVKGGSGKVITGAVLVNGKVI